MHEFRGGGEGGVCVGGGVVWGQYSEAGLQGGPIERPVVESAVVLVVME
jgi:hypothetical protein